MWWRCGRNRNAARNPILPMAQTNSNPYHRFRAYGPLRGRHERRDSGDLPDGADGGHDAPGEPVRDYRRRVHDRAGVAVLSEKDGARSGGGSGSGDGAAPDSDGGGRAVFHCAGQRCALDDLRHGEAQDPADLERAVVPQAGEPHVSRAGHLRAGGGAPGGGREAGGIRQADRGLPAPGVRQTAAGRKAHLERPDFEDRPFRQPDHQLPHCGFSATWRGAISAWRWGRTN